MSAPAKTQTGGVSAVPAEPMTIDALAGVVSRTLQQDGMDRMTNKQVEEILSVPALTGHI
ncbi:hypothetical protein [Saccharopolyspora phatthalungensis]|uniref:Uncharacterized protein n=1 Tax=Saccharopolyspora phatthalungensis TaxID=664693 RepID=A0A840QHJ7_9PSEU|nr:hypothetical protein [Saccharopolyspora phatthalungensis]MBB5159651.1 hypothetical protein [Saccharopolyspora phatthalungensis]